MLSETRKILDQLDEALVNSSPEVVREVWDVLTALRGPDGNHDIDYGKNQYTVYVRQAALPKLCTPSEKDGVQYYNPAGAQIKSPIPRGICPLPTAIEDLNKDPTAPIAEIVNRLSYHFRVHIYHAGIVFGWWKPHDHKW